MVGDSDVPSEDYYFLGETASTSLDRIVDGLENYIKSLIDGFELLFDLLLALDPLEKTD